MAVAQALKDYEKAEGKEAAAPKPVVEEEPMDEAAVLIYGGSFSMLPRAMRMARTIRKASRVCSIGTLALFALLLLLGLLGTLELWAALLLLLLGRLASLIYPHYFCR